MNDWKKVKLSELADITMGQSPKSDFYNLDGNGLPFLQGNRTFGDKYPIFDTWTTFVTKEAEAGDVIMSVRAPVGDINITPLRICLGRGVCGLRHKEGAQEFLYYLLRANKENLVNRENGTVFGSINKNDISNLEVLVPSLEEQIEIGLTLKTIDDKIENNKKINHHLAAISKNYLKIFYSSNSIKLGDIFELKSGYAFKSKDWVDEGKPVIKIKDIDGITIDITNLNYVKNKSQLSKASNFEVFGKEIVMALTGATTGKIGVIPKNFKGYVNQRVGLFYAKTELSYAVLWSILQQQNIITDLIKLSSGSAQANLSPFSVNSYDLNVTFKDLIELDKVLSPLYELFCFNLSEIQRLSELRDTLLPKLLSGELSVNQAAK